jgi:hypothetical protein
MTIQQTPCQTNPDAWEIPTRGLAHTRAQVAVRAVAGCRTCPLLANCRTQANQLRPTDDCIQAATVWINGEERNLEAWLQSLATAPNRDPDGNGICEACGTSFPTHKHQQRYCSRGCAGAGADGHRPHRQTITVADLLRPPVPATTQVAALKPCGTIAAYRRHKGRGEPVDVACLLVQRQYERDKKRTQAAKAGRSPQVLAPCGTVSGYNRHLRRAETACRACRDAIAAYKRHSRGRAA